MKPAGYIVLSKKQKIIFSIIGLSIIVALIVFANYISKQDESSFRPYHLRILNLCAVYIILGLSLNLVNGFTGLFSLGHAGFMAVGAYTYALLSMSPAAKERVFFLEPIVPALANLQLPVPLALICAGLMAAFAGVLVGWPALRLRDDYLAIATLGFSEIIRIVITNVQRVTNGAQGLRGFPQYTPTFVVWGIAFIAVIFILALTRSAFGRSCKAIRDNEIAAQAMGINIARVKLTSFTIASFMAGIGGALLAHLNQALDPRLFAFVMTYNVLLIVVLGGIGSITGSIIGAILVTVGLEWLRFLDRPLNLIFVTTPGTPGLRMVVFSLLLLSVILFRQQGLMGGKEFSWEAIVNIPFRLAKLHRDLHVKFDRKKNKGAQ